jgi:hypothetical protein
LYAVSEAFGSSLKHLILVNKSADGGLTWSSPIQVNSDSNADSNHRADKPSITADPIHPGYIYAAWNRGQSETVFTRTVDGGQTWEPSRVIHLAPTGGFDWGQQIIVLPDGTLVCAFTDAEAGNFAQVGLTLLRSSDQGQTWSDPISAVVQQPQIPTGLSGFNAVTDPDTGQQVEAHPFADSIALDRSRGTLYAVWLDGRFSNFQYNSIALSMSSDGGLTWSEPIQVNQTPSTVPPSDRQAWNPTVAVAADGTVGVSYYDFRNNTPAPGALTDYWLASGHPSATAPATKPAKWNEVRLTDTSFDLEQAAARFEGGLFLGDFDGLAAAGNDFVAVWGMPDATKPEDIFFRRAISGDSGMSRATVSHTRFVASGLHNNFTRLLGAADGSGSTSPTRSLPVDVPLAGLPAQARVNRVAAVPAGPLSATRQHRGARFQTDLDGGLLADGFPGEPGV